MIFEIDLLQDYEIKQIQDHLNNISYISGKLSSGENKKVKLSQVVNQQDIRYKPIYDIILSAISSNNVISSFLNAKKITPPQIVKYTTGGFYDWHVDELQICDTVTHYSMTIFLDDDYVGGELVLKQNDKELKYKLPAGKAIIYSTGILHKVSNIEEGSRTVAICWIESLIRDEFMRNCIFEMGKITSDLCVESCNSNDVIQDASKKLLAYEQVRINMIRQYGNF